MAWMYICIKTSKVFVVLSVMFTACWHVAWSSSGTTEKPVNLIAEAVINGKTRRREMAWLSLIIFRGICAQPEEHWHISISTWLQRTRTEENMSCHRAWESKTADMDVSIKTSSNRLFEQMFTYNVDFNISQYQTTVTFLKFAHLPICSCKISNRVVEAHVKRETNTNKRLTFWGRKSP